MRARPNTRRVLLLATLLLLGAGCGGSDSGTKADATVKPEAGKVDARPFDGKVPDALPKTDAKKPDGALSPDAAKPDAKKPDGALKPDTAKPDAKKPDGALKPDAAKPDAAKPDAAKPDAAKPDAAKPDAAKPDVAKPDAAKLPDTGSTKPLNATAPAATVRLVFIHHSTGEAWSDPSAGNLRQKLNDNNYYMADTNYGWGPADANTANGETIGDHTDWGHWWNWFLSPTAATYLAALYSDADLTSSLGANTIAKPAGDNTVIMFKSCFIAGDIVGGNPTDAPLAVGVPNPLYGEPEWNDQFYTVANMKGLYRDLLTTFATRQDKLFILITTPPSYVGDTTSASAANLRAVNTWLVHSWLQSYPHSNVAVFDYYTVLTSSGGDPDTSDLGTASGGHHRLSSGVVQHLVASGNVSAYPSPGGDSHPTAAGHLKATAEFLPLLNVAYHCWKGTGSCPLLMGRE